MRRLDFMWRVAFSKLLFLSMVLFLAAPFFSTAQEVHQDVQERAAAEVLEVGTGNNRYGCNENSTDSPDQIYIWFEGRGVRHHH